jgi:hypothetical protein
MVALFMDEKPLKAVILVKEAYSSIEVREIMADVGIIGNNFVM